MEKYAEILKCAQNYDMEKHQRKLKRMEEKKQAEEGYHRRTIFPNKRNFMMTDKMKRELMQGVERVMNQYNFDDLKQLQNWILMMTKNKA